MPGSRAVCGTFDPVGAIKCGLGSLKGRANSRVGCTGECVWGREGVQCASGTLASMRVRRGWKRSRMRHRRPPPHSGMSGPQSAAAALVGGAARVGARAPVAGPPAEEGAGHLRLLGRPRVGGLALDVGAGECSDGRSPRAGSGAAAALLSTRATNWASWRNAAGCYSGTFLCASGGGPACVARRGGSGPMSVGPLLCRALWGGMTVRRGQVGA